ncbi:uncharacterized protein LOC119859440 [Dermochelys coriacea]|uniref:uncharacterized protein LOC119859440 n=1 Tax=Dermochelys coriacea TaxID=27794 RepID=UPI001CA9CBBE|nr:uncharacterized protein LOC119859440 [Dermochelys coriacea]
MDWLQGLERGCQPGPEEATLWMELCWEIGDCSEPSPRPPGKGQRLQAPRHGPGHQRSSGKTRGRESSLEFAEEPAPWLPCAGPGAELAPGTSGGCLGLEGAGEDPKRDWGAALLLMETPAATWIGQTCPCPVQPGWLPMCHGRAQGCLVPACLVLRPCHDARE